jgi:hypothetical protein
VPFDLFDNVLLQDFSLKAFERALQALSIVKLNFSQLNSPRFQLGSTLQRSSLPAGTDSGAALNTALQRPSATLGRGPCEKPLHRAEGRRGVRLPSFTLLPARCTSWLWCGSAADLKPGAVFIAPVLRWVERAPGLSTHQLSNFFSATMKRRGLLSLSRKTI